ncbi:Sialin [Portunus trituberculatus]|uniref:Sialin n=1 Tax=Portunus trituberculatus TaxID=210409 RepID=A0A5B7CQ63_PORTR|nr:Sialin [Portunus trituberculatus]
MGYLWTQIPGGRIAELFGARRVFGGALTAASLLSLLIPFTARANAAPLIANRILLGISEVCSQAGTVVAYPLSSALITSLGWESVFYVQSCITLVWCFAWFMLVADSPYVDTKITDAEKKYIIAAIGDDKDRKLGPAACLMGITFLHCDRTSTIALFTLATTLQGGIYTGFMVNHIDIAPNFAGTLFGMTNAMGTIPSWVGPLIAGSLTKNQQTFEQWNKVFYIAAGIYVANALFYLGFASGKVQPWNHVTEPAGVTKTKSASVAKDSRSTQTKPRAISNSTYDAYVVTPHATAYVNPAYKH